MFTQTMIQEGLWASPDVQLEGRSDLLGPAGVLLCLRLFTACMSPQQQRFDGIFGLAGGQGVICPAEGQDQGGLVVSMRLVAAHDTAEGLLIRPIGSGDKVAAGALLRTVCRIDRVGSSPSLRCCPGQLVGNMAELGRIQVGVHGARMKAQKATERFS